MPDFRPASIVIDTEARQQAQRAETKADHAVAAVDGLRSEMGDMRKEAHADHIKDRGILDAGLTAVNARIDKIGSKMQLRMDESDSLFRSWLFRLMIGAIVLLLGVIGYLISSGLPWVQ